MNSLSYIKLFESSIDMHCILDASGVMTHMNPRLTAVLGWTSEELVGQQLEALVHPDEKPHLYAAPRDGEELCTRRYMHSDGSVRWLEWSRHVLPDDGAYLVGRDVTARVVAMRAQALQKCLFEESLKLSRSGYFTMHVKDQELFWSDGIYKIHGRDVSRGVPPLEEAINYYHPDDRAKVGAHLERAVEHHAPFDFQLRLIHDNDQQERLVHAIGIPMDDDHGEVELIFGIFRDLTDDPSFVRQQELEHFAFMASHDLREPLRIIRLYLDLLSQRQEELTASSAQEYWGRVQQAATRMDALVQDLYLYASAGQHVKVAPVSLDHTFQEALAHMSEDLVNADAQVQLPHDLPMVLGERTHLRRALVQIFSNAIKFHQDGSTTKIDVTWRARGNYIEFIVRDHGQGFDEKYATQIFKPFKTLGHAREGTGMGLAIVHRIVQQCDGRVWATCKPGEGAAFHIMLLKASS